LLAHSTRSSSSTVRHWSCGRWFRPTCFAEINTCSDVFPSTFNRVRRAAGRRGVGDGTPSLTGARGDANTWTDLAPVYTGWSAGRYQTTTGPNDALLYVALKTSHRIFWVTACSLLLY